jgi:hypothetical protein
VRRYLVVANQTLGEDQLVELLKRRAKSEPSEFFILVPATPSIEYVSVAAIPVMGGFPVLPDSVEHSRQLAQERLDAALAQLADIDASVEGCVGGADPLSAVESVLTARQFDEIIVSTLPKRVSKWLRSDLPCRLGRKSGLPVTHVGV